MRAGVLGAAHFGLARGRTVRQAEESLHEEHVSRRVQGWDAEQFAAEQIRNLVRRVFDPGGASAIRQVVITAIDADSPVRDIAQRIGQTLASESAQDVAIVGADPQVQMGELAHGHSLKNSALLSRNNVWLLPFPDTTNATESMQTYLARIRCEFAYSVIAASEGAATEAQRAGKFSDGVILVLSAMRTRRAAARRFLETLPPVQLLGTVLSDRDFPIPERIYRRL